MRECKKTYKRLPAYLSGELGKEDRERIEAHLEFCPRCRRETASMAAVMEEAESGAPDFEQAMAPIDWDRLPERMADRVFGDQIRTPAWEGSAGGGAFFFRTHWKPVLAALLTGALLGVLTTTWWMRSDRRSPSTGKAYSVSREFLEKVDLEMARRETLDYLEKSQVLLLDFVQADPSGAARMWSGDVASRQARSLLSQKKYINRQLDKFRMAKAKQICDQIEMLIFELAQVSDGLTEEEISNIQDYIGKKQLLLKINLLQHELEKNEV